MNVFMTQTERYSGPDRRRDRDRRSHAQRRVDIRFEAKQDRRGGKDRRSHGKWDDMPLR